MLIRGTALLIRGASADAAGQQAVRALIRISLAGAELLSPVAAARGTVSAISAANRSR